MRTHHEPSQKRRVKVEGGEVQTYSYGTSEDVILFMHGGPAMQSRHIRNTHCWLVDHGFRVVSWDQLGCGDSERPKDASLWTLERFTDEVETVRRELSLGSIHLYGHSWGGMLAISYALKFQKNLKSLIIANGIANVPFHHQEAQRMLAAFGPEFVAMRRRHEYAGTTQSPEYKASNVLLNYRHVCRMPFWPKEMIEDLEAIDPAIFNALFGGTEWNMQLGGRQANCNLVPLMGDIRVPTLVMVGEHDELSPDQAQEMHAALPNSTLRYFRNVAHMLMYECPEEYDRELLAFLKEHAATRGRR